jgi:hypoxanthine phosphoribosyltransferase
MSVPEPSRSRDSEGRRLGRILVEEPAIARRNDELAQAIRRELPDDEPVVVGLLTGSFVFVADLSRALSRCGVRPRVHFLQTSHYGAGRHPQGRVALLRDLDANVKGRSVLIVDDILDSGRSLKQVRGLLEDRGASWLKSCVLLDKAGRRSEEIEADWVGFEVEDTWVVGYGLDDAGAYRELPFVAELLPSPAEGAD